MPLPRPIYINNDGRLRLKKLRTIDALTTPVLDATVTYSLIKLEDGSVVSSGTLPVQGSDGYYWATVDKTVTSLLEVDGQYKFVIEAENDDGDEGEWVLYCYGAER